MNYGFIMNYGINIESNISKIAKYMDDLEKKQLPFAVSLTLNKLALLSQEYICKSIPFIFNNSKKWWDKHQKTGVKVAFSNKYYLVSAVYCKAHFAYIQEEGGVKLPYRSSMLAVPTVNVPKRQRSARALRERQGDKTIFRLGKSIYRRISNQRLQKLYSLTEAAKIKPRFGFKKKAIEVANRQLDKVFTKEFNYALATAK